MIYETIPRQTKTAPKLTMKRKYHCDLSIFGGGEGGRGGDSISIVPIGARVREREWRRITSLINVLRRPCLIKRIVPHTPPHLHVSHGSPADAPGARERSINCCVRFRFESIQISTPGERRDEPGRRRLSWARNHLRSSRRPADAFAIIQRRRNN